MYRKLSRRNTLSMKRAPSFHQSLISKIVTWNQETICKRWSENGNGIVSMTIGGTMEALFLLPSFQSTFKSRIRCFQRQMKMERFARWWSYSVFYLNHIFCLWKFFKLPFPCARIQLLKLISSPAWTSQPLRGTALSAHFRIDFQPIRLQFFCHGAMPNAMHTMFWLISKKHYFHWFPFSLFLFVFSNISARRCFTAVEMVIK